MRIKLIFENFPKGFPTAFLLSIESQMETFLDLHHFIYNKFELNKFLENDCSLRFEIEGFQVFNTEKLKNILKDDDIVSVSPDLKRKRKFEKEGNECEFCEFVHKFCKLRDLFYDFPQKKFHIEEKFNENKKDKNTLLDQDQEKNFPQKEIKKIEKKEKQIEKQENKPLAKQEKIIIRKTISSSDESQSESSDEEISIKVKKPIEKNEIIKKTAMNNCKDLNILSPEDEFAKKKSSWQMVPNNPKVIPKQNFLSEKKIQNNFTSKETQNKNPIQNQIIKPPIEIEQNKKIITPKEIIPKYITLNPIILKKYSIVNGNSFLQVEDNIRFKSYELGDSNFPILSDWKQGKIDLIKDDLFYLSGFEEGFGIGQFHSIEIEENIIANRLNEYKKIEQLINEENKQKDENKKKKNEYSIEQSTARQVNYYFSEKNYHKDDFIQAHIKKNSDKCKLFDLFSLNLLDMEIKLLMNFPKIKQIIANSQELTSILIQFLQENPDQCNFELDETKQFIRKKN